MSTDGFKRRRQSKDLAESAPGERAPKRGGKPKPAEERKRHTLTFRLRDGLRTDLETAAKENGRSVSEEIEFRLERDFMLERSRRHYEVLFTEAEHARRAWFERMIQSSVASAVKLGLEESRMAELAIKEFPK